MPKSSDKGDSLAHSFNENTPGWSSLHSLAADSWPVPAFNPGASLLWFLIVGGFEHHFRPGDPQTDPFSLDLSPELRTSASNSERFHWEVSWPPAPQLPNPAPLSVGGRSGGSLVVGPAFRSVTPLFSLPTADGPANPTALPPEDSRSPAPPHSLQG